MTGVTSRAPCPASTTGARREAGLRLLEDHGSTETGGIGWREDERAPFRLLSLWAQDGDQGPADTGPGPHRRMNLPYHLAWEGPDRLRLLGRRDGAVQVAGVNVWPERVVSVLRAHHGVSDARARLMPPDEGDWLKGFVVPREASFPDGLRRDLDGWCRQSRSAPERPSARARLR